MFEQHNRVLVQKAHRDGVVPGGDREGVATLVQAVPFDAGMLPSSRSFLSNKCSIVFGCGQCCFS